MGEGKRVLVLDTSKNRNFLFATFAIVFLVSLVSFVSFASASYSISNYSIQDHSSPGSPVYGTVNISFFNEPINANFTDSFGNSVSLKDLLNSPSNFGYLYNCSSANCTPSFFTSNPQASKSFTLKAGESKLLGFVLNGNISDITNVSFSLSSNALPSNSSQLSLNFFGNGTYILRNTKVGLPLYTEKTFGCFNPSYSQEATLGANTLYCERVSIPTSPSVELGLWAKKDSGNANISMSLYSTSGGYLGGCQINSSSVSTSGAESFCDMNSSVSSGDYYVCSILGTGSGNFKLRGYSLANNTCGFLGKPPATETAAYQIGAIPFGYATPGNMQVENQINNKVTLAYLFLRYTQKNYPQGCAQGCYIPFEVNSNANQNITLSNLNFVYNTNSLVGASLSKFYGFSKKVSLVNSTMQILSLGNFFKLPSFTGVIPFILNLDGSQLFSTAIFYQSVSVSVSPQSIPENVSTNFFATIPNSYSVAGYSWSFGDNTTSVTTIEPKVLHRYSKAGNYTLTLSFYSNNTIFSKNFNVEVLPASVFLNRELPKKQTALLNFEGNLSRFSSFEAQSIKEQVGLSNISSELSSIKAGVSSATNESEYATLLSELSSISVPTSVYVTSSETPFLTSADSVSLNDLGNITGEVYSSGNASSYISYWDYKNLDSKLTTQTALIQMDDGSNTQVNIYALSITPQNSINESYYLIFPYSQGLTFETNSGVISRNGFSYIPLSSKPQKIYFSSVQDVGNSFFIAPKKVIVSNSVPISVYRSQALVWIIISLIVVLIVGLIVYVVLVKWYSTKYERYLFPDKNQLYNAIVYITNSLKNGMSEGEVRSSLLKAGWKGEQVAYLMKKYAGKRTGMVDLFGVSRQTSSAPSPGMNSQYDRIPRDTKFNK